MRAQLERIRNNIIVIKNTSRQYKGGGGARACPCPETVVKRARLTKNRTRRRATAVLCTIMTFHVTSEPLNIKTRRAGAHTRSKLDEMIRLDELCPGVKHKTPVSPQHKVWRANVTGRGGEVHLDRNNGESLAVQITVMMTEVKHCGTQDWMTMRGTKRGGFEMR